MSILQRDKVEVTISNRTVLRVLAVGIGSVLALLLVFKLRNAITLLFISAFLAMALNPAVSWLSKKLRIKSRVRSAAIAYVVVLTILLSFFSLVVPPLFRQTTDFVSTLPVKISEFKTQDGSASKFVRQYNLDDQLTDFGKDFSSKSTRLRGQAFNVAGRVGGALISLITVLVLTFMLLVEGPGLIDKFWEVQSKENRLKYRRLSMRMYGVVTGYVTGQLIITVIASSASLIAMLIASTVIGKSINVVALAGIVALFGLIPLIGNTLAAVIVVFACLLTSPILAIVMAIFFVVYQQIENVTIQPYIQARKNEMTPLVVFVSALLGASFGGLLGAFVAIPTAGCIKILIEENYSNRKSKNASTNVAE